MDINRRRFFKHLAVAVTAAAIAPAALIDESVEAIKSVPKSGKPYHGATCEWITFDELQARFPARLDKNPLFRGELGIYNGITIHSEK